MSLIQRAQKILLSPKAEWPVIDEEQSSVGQLFTGYAMILALIPALAGIVFGLIITGPFGVRFGMGYLLTAGVLGYVIGLAVLYLMGIIGNALATNFQGTQSQLGAMKLVVYSATAVWVASIFLVIPILGWLVVLAGYGYAAYLLYLGCQSTLRVPQNNAVGFTAVLIIIWIVVGFIANWIISSIAWRMFIGSSVYSGLY